MQDEIRKHTKKVYDTLNSPTQMFGEKAKEVFIEIATIVFAILLSTYIHGQTEHAHEQVEVKAFITDLRQDLEKDINDMNIGIKYFDDYSKRITFLLNITDTQRDSLNKVKSNVNIFGPLGNSIYNTGAYEGFKSSGKVGNIENSTLKRNILFYYQQQLPDIFRSETLSTTNIYTLKEAYLNIGQKEKLLKNRKIRIILTEAFGYSKMMIEVYQKAIVTAKEVTKEIDKELAE